MPSGFKDLDTMGKVLGILNIFTGVVFIGLVVPYIIVIASPQIESAYIVVYVISLVMNIVIGVCGIIVPFCLYQALLMSYGCINIVMFLLSLAQLIWAYVSLINCNTTGQPGGLPLDENPFGFFFVRIKMI